MEAVTAVAAPTIEWSDMVAAVGGAILRTPTGLWHRTDDVGILYPGKTNVFYGEAESGKTMGALAAAVAFLSVGGAVFFLDYEMALEDVAGRLKSLGATPELVTQLYYSMWPDPETMPRRITDIVERASELPEDHPGVLVIVDSVDEFLYSLGSDPNKQEAGNVTRHILGVPLNEFGVTLLLIDHSSGSQAGSAKTGPAGSYRKLANTDLALKFEVRGQRPTRGSKATVDLKVHKDRPGTLRALCADAASGGSKGLFATMVVDSTWDPDLITLTVEPATARMRMGIEERVLLMIYEAKAFDEDHTTTPPQIAVRWGALVDEGQLEPLKDSKTVSNAFTRLIKKDLLNKQGSLYYLAEQGKQRARHLQGAVDNEE